MILAEVLEFKPLQDKPKKIQAPKGPVSPRLLLVTTMYQLSNDAIGWEWRKFYRILIFREEKSM